jgi:hypothetical protein
MDIMTQVITAADQINFDRIRVALLYAYKSLQAAPTMLNQITYWEAHDNYLALSQIVPSREWQM